MMVIGGSELIGLLVRAFLLILMSGIILVAIVPLRIKSLISIITVFLVAASTSILAIMAFSADGIEYIADGGYFFGNIPLRIDTLSAWFILLINLTTFTGVIYGSAYLRNVNSGSPFIAFHWILYLIFQSSMILVSIVQHSIIFIIVWEFMSLSSFLLVMFDYTNQRVIKAGINYLVQMHLSVILLTVAFIWVYTKTGTFDFRGIGLFFGTNVNIWLFLLFFAGFGLKAGFIGLHTWLPQAHPSAPSHISGVMSGVIVKMGIYGIFRVISFLKADFVILGDIVLSISIITGLYGIMNSAVHRDFKKMLAYCTIENIGIIGVGIGLGLIGIGKDQSLLIFFGFGGALLHVLNHSLYKSLLFFSAGSVYRQTHTRDMDKLGGLFSKMPQTAILFLAGALAIGGMPPLNGFISEFLIYSGIISGINNAGISQITLMILTFAGMSLIGGISILTFTKTFGTIFLGSPRQNPDHEPVEVSSLMLVPQYIILAFMLLIAFFPGLFITLAGKVLGTNSFPALHFETDGIQRFLSVMKNISLTSVIFFLIVGIVFFIRWSISRKTVKSIDSTWGCGYGASNSRMQYTGKSYSKTFGKLLNFVMIEKKGYSEIDKNEIFPSERKYHSFYLDFFETRIINPVLQIITKFINLFQFIQNGRIQAYVIYGIVFILTIFLGTILNFWH